MTDDEPAPQVSVVVPLCDEEDNLPVLYRRLCDTLDATGVGFELVFVNDGSTDRTPALLDRLAAADPRVVAVHFSRNFGHQPAVTAGIDFARGDAVVVMDGDLQDPPEVLPGFIERWREGFDVVYAVRTKRKEGVFKRLGYWAFYRLFRAVADVDVPLDSGDFGLIDRRVADVLRALPERQRFVRGLRSFAGFTQTGLEYERDARAAGTPKYTLRKLAGLAAAGLLDFSPLPVRLLFLGGVVLAACGFAAGVAAAASASGWLAVVAAVLAVGGAELLGLGVVGEYARRIFLEVKGRPPYIVRDVRRTAAHSRREPEPAPRRAA